MKRFSKIFALLLALCLLCGMVSIIASAAELNAKKLDSGSTGITNRKTYTFENGISSDGYPLDVTGNTKFTALSSSDSGKKIIDSDLVEEENGNHYIRYHHGDEIISMNKYVTFTQLANSTYRAPDYKYVVIDLDFTTDAYLNQDGTDIDPNATSGKLAYPEGAAFSPRGNVASVYFTDISIVSNGNDWYIGNSPTYDSSTKLVKIESEKIGVWTHVTFVFDTSGRYFVYINGEYAWSANVKPNDANSIYHNDFNFRITKGNTNKWQYSLCVDNLTSNIYDSTYKSADDVYGLDDFIATDYSSNIAHCKDVVYNYDNYAGIEEPKTKFVVGDKEFILLSSALAVMERGDVLTAYQDFAFPAVVLKDSFTVVCENGAKLTLASKAFDAYVVSEKVEGDKTTYSFVYNPAYEIEGISTYNYQTFSGSQALETQNTAFSNFINSANKKSEDGNGFAAIWPKVNGKIASNTTALFYAMSKSGTNTVSEHSFYTIDFDFATNGNCYEGMRLAMFSNLPSSAYSYFGYTVSNDGKWYIGDKSTYATSTKHYELPAADVWTHFTLVAYDTGTSYGYDVYINGEYFQTVTTKAGFRMERLCVYFAKDSVIDVNDTWEVRMDNIYVKSYGTSDKPYFSGNAFGLDDYTALGDKTLPLTFLDDIIYNPVFSFKLPNTPSVDIGNGKYYNLAAAFANLKNGDKITLTDDLKLYAPLKSYIKTLNVEGANIILIGKVADLYTYENGVLTRKILYTADWTDGKDVIISQDIDCATAPNPSSVDADFGIKGNYKNTKAWEISFGGEFVALDGINWTALENGAKVTLRPITGTVSWFDSDGTTQVGETETYFAATVLEPRSYEGLRTFPLLDNGWYEWGYAAWNSAEEDYVVETGENKFVAIEGVISSIDAKFNYNLGLTARPTVYLPEALENVEVVSVINVSTTSKDLLKGKNVVINSDNYTAYVGESLSVYAWYPPQTFEITFNVTLGEEIHTVKTEISATTAGYINSVIKTYDCGSPEENLVLNWVRYIAHGYASLYSANGGLLGAAESVLENHDKTCLAANLESLESQTPDAPDASLTYKEMGQLGDGFGASYALTSSSIRFGVYVPVEYADANPDMKITVSLRGIANMKTNQYISGDLFRYTVDDKGVISTPTFTVNGVKSYLYIASQDLISMYNAKEVLTVNFTSGEINKTVTYSLDEYIYNLSAALAAKETPTVAETRNLEFVQALSAFAKASRAYVLDGVEIPE